MKKNSLQSGSALLITVLLMGILMTLTLGISNLVIKEISLTQTIVDANKAYYAAEAGVEQALLALKNQYPGYEENLKVANESADEIGEGESSGSNNEDILKLSDDLKALDSNYSFDFLIKNTAHSVPDFDENKPIFVENCQITSANNIFAIAMTREQLYQDCPATTFRRLALSETHTIPLFIADSAENSDTVKVENFIVQYYTATSDLKDGVLKGLGLANFDVLRWKLYGTPNNDAGVRKTNSISDLYPAKDNNSAAEPVCIGTDNTIQSPADENCSFPLLTPDSISEQYSSDYRINAGVNSGASGMDFWSAARQCYLTEAGEMVTAGAQIKAGDGGCTMKDFILNHEQNYLVLTNMINPSVVGISNVDDPIQLRKADIYYRILIADSEMSDEGSDFESFVQEAKLVKDYAEISANGFALPNGRVTKSLNVLYKAPSYLPVFNFSLYNTKGESNSGE